VCGNRNDLHKSSTVIAELTAAMAAGAFIHTNSWHFDTTDAATGLRGTPRMPPMSTRSRSSTRTTSCWDRLATTARRPARPATAKNAVCVGAAKADPAAPQFGDGNPGPTADGRHKPASWRSDATFSQRAWAPAAGPVGSGSSRIAPRASLPRARLRPPRSRVQYFTEGFHPSGTRRAGDAITPSGALLKAVLVNSTVALTGIPETSVQRRGLGSCAARPDAEISLISGGSFAVWDVRHAAGPTRGEVRTQTSTCQLRRRSCELRSCGAIPRRAVPTRSVWSTSYASQSLAGREHPGERHDDPVQMIQIAAPSAAKWEIDVEATEVVDGRPGQGTQSWP
jgi:hypothetical protein